MQSTKKENEFTKQEILEIFQDVRKEHGKITQLLVTKNSSLTGRKIMDYFGTFTEAKLELSIWESDYIDVEIKNRDDYQPVLLKLLKACDEKHGKVTRKLIGEDENMPRISDYRREFETLTTAKIKANLNSNNVIQFTDEQLENQEEEMLELIQKCKKEHGIATMALIRDMDTYIKVEHILNHFGDFMTAKKMCIDNPVYGKFQPDKTYTPEEVLKAMKECELKHDKVTRDIFCKEYMPRSVVEKHFNTFSEAKQKANLNNIGRIKKTDEEMNRLNNIIKNNQKIREIIKGLLMGDGSIDIGDGNCEACLRVGMANKPFLDWLDKTYLSEISRGVRHKCTPEEGAKNVRKTGFRPNAKAENYSHIYELSTRRLPDLSKIHKEWYSNNGSKYYPNNLELTPLSTKMWYCGDGGINITGNYCSIKCSNESKRVQYIKNLFDDINIDITFKNGVIRINKKQSPKLLHYMGKAPIGFEYKWELNNRDRYYKVKKRADTQIID